MEGHYALYELSSPYVKVDIPITSPTGTSQDPGKYDFRGSISYGCDTTDYVDVYGHLSGSTGELCVKVSEAFELAKRFQSNESLQKFLRGASTDSQQQPPT